MKEVEQIIISLFMQANLNEDEAQSLYDSLMDNIESIADYTAEDLLENDYDENPASNES